MDDRLPGWAPEPFSDTPMALEGSEASVAAGDAVRPCRANVARVYDCLLGGKDHFEADRVVAERIGQGAPWIPAGARANRAFLVRAVECLVRAGVDQFLDIGTGLPTARNVHEVARDISPNVRVVYVDHDPVVVCHARALLARQDGVCAVEADARDPAGVLEQACGVGGLDLSRPVGLLFVAVLHFVAEAEDPDGILRAFARVLPSGSFLVLSHGLSITGRGASRRRQALLAYQQDTAPVTLRSRRRITELFDGWDLVPPGLVEIDQWRPVTRRPTRTRVPVLAGVARLAPPPTQGKDVVMRGG